MKRVILFFLLISSLTGCATIPDHINDGNLSIAAPNQTAPSSTLDSTSSILESSTTEVYNTTLAKLYHNREYNCSLRTANDTPIIIDAKVVSDQVERVSKYTYIPKSITDEERTALFKEYFQEKANEIYHHTVGNSNCWILKNENDSYMFNYGRGYGSIDETLFSLRNQNIQTSAFPQNMLTSISDTNISLDDAFNKCAPLLTVLVSDVMYDADWIRPFPLPNATDNKGFFLITYRRVVDGMPITANFDLRFFVSEREIIRVLGTLYDMEEVPLDQYIISVDDAIKSLEDHSALIYIQNLGIEDEYIGSIPVSEISLEYLVIRGLDYTYEITPVWRFIIGENEEQRMMHRDKIIAVNAITGQVIVEQRGIQM